MRIKELKSFLNKNNYNYSNGRGGSDIIVTFNNLKRRYFIKTLIVDYALHEVDAIVLPYTKDTQYFVTRGIDFSSIPDYCRFKIEDNEDINLSIDDVGQFVFNVQNQT